MLVTLSVPRGAEVAGHSGVLHHMAVCVHDVEVQDAELRWAQLSCGSEFSHLPSTAAHRRYDAWELTRDGSTLVSSLPDEPDLWALEEGVIGGIVKLSQAQLMKLRSVQVAFEQSIGKWWTWLVFLFAAYGVVS